VKRLAVIACMVLIVGASSAANATAWFAGVMGGVNWGELSGVDETSTNPGFTGGAFLEAEFTDQFGARVEAMYTQKGAERNSNPEFGDNDTRVNLNYIEFPVLFVVSLSNSATSDFDIFAGPVFGFNTSAEEVPDEGATVDLSDYVNSSEVSGVFGVDFEHIRSSFSIFGDLRYTIGATDIFASNSGASGSLADAKNRGFAFLVGLKFGLGG